MSALILTAAERAAPGRPAAQAAALRRNTVAALGELLFYVITQEAPTAPPTPRVVDAAEAWDIPIAAVGGVIGKCLLADGGGGGSGVQHYAAKTLENVLAQVGPRHPLVAALVTPELALGLLDLAR